MSNLQLNPGSAAGGVDRPLLVPAHAQLDDTTVNRLSEAKASRRRMNAVRVRVADMGLRPFRVY